MKKLDDETIEIKAIPNLSIQTKTRDIVDYVGKGSQNSVQESPVFLFAHRFEFETLVKS